MKAMRVALGMLAGAVVALSASALWMAVQPAPTAFGGTGVSLSEYRGSSPTGAAKELLATDAVTRGRYLISAADCEACHTAKDGVPFAGGRRFKLPFGDIYSPNITPDDKTGIGEWSDEDFLRAVRAGVGRHGEHLYPVFPFASYSLLTDADVLAIKAYLFSLRPVSQPSQSNTFSFPFNQRSLMSIWSALFNRNQRFRPSPTQSAAWNRGAYLVEAAGHCGECHSPRNLFQAVNQRRKFGGGVAEGWTAYNITSDDGTGIGAWSASELSGYLSTGHSPTRGTAAGPMAEVIALSTSRLSASDLTAMATYLRSIPALRTASVPKARPGAALMGTMTVASGNIAGRRVFEGACASCHAWNGSGAIVTEAGLIASTAVHDPAGVNVALMILGGSATTAPDRSFMPGFAATYSDTEIAAATNYVTGRFGTKASEITARDVATLRRLSN